jgi:hypothetical protein
MLRKPTNEITDENVRSHLEFIQEEGQGKIIILSAAPTASEPLLDANEIGSYGNDIYWRIGQVIHKFSSDTQITIT